MCCFCFINALKTHVTNPLPIHGSMFLGIGAERMPAIQILDSWSSVVDGPEANDLETIVLGNGIHANVHCNIENKHTHIKIYLYAYKKRHISF